MKYADEKALFDFIKSLRLVASKDLGQNFLIDPVIASSIVDALGVQENEKVLEIGAGFGSLSYYLAAKDAEITLLDVDARAIVFLNEQFVDRSNVKIVQESILKHDVTSYHRIIGDLPYYLTTDTIENMLLNGVSSKRLIFMIQKEVLPRLIAKPGAEGYGPLSILISYLGSAKRLMSVNRREFVPAPKVDSVVLTIDIDPDKSHETAENLLKIVKRLFHHRRKTIKNNLRLLLDDADVVDGLLADLKVDGSQRPQDLGLDFYLALTKRLKF